MPTGARYHSWARGFTLMELLVVLVLMGLAAALAAPAFLSKNRGPSGLESLIPAARELAARRGELIYLRIAASGTWRIEGGTSTDTAAIVSGSVDPFPGLPLTLLVSPLGSCAFDVRSTAAAQAIRLDPLSCEITKP